MLLKVPIDHWKASKIFSRFQMLGQFMNWAYGRASDRADDSLGSRIEDLIAQRCDKENKGLYIKFLDNANRDVLSPDLVHIGRKNSNWVITAMAITGSSRYSFTQLDYITKGYYAMESTLYNLEQANRYGLGTALLYYDALGYIKALKKNVFIRLEQNGKEKRLYRPDCFINWIRVPEINEMITWRFDGNTR